jgi:Spy/CpxP family protein refolding chaperone
MSSDTATLAVLSRIADALERLAPPPPAASDIRAADGFVWDAAHTRLEPVRKINRIPIDLLRGIELQRRTLFENTERFALGLPANNALLWGARGMGKSSLVKAVHAEINAKQGAFTRNFTATNGTKLADLDKAAKEDTAAGKKDEAKAKREEIAKIRAELVKANAEFRAEALAVLSPAQQKQLLVSQAQRTALSLNPFKSVNLTAEQIKTVQDKIAGEIDSITTENKEVDRRKLNALVLSLSNEVLTADQKADYERQVNEAKAKAAAAKAATPAAK